MMERLPRPLKFDNTLDWFIVARDGERFYIAPGSKIREDPNMPMDQIGPKTLLEWAMEINYPIAKFVRLQKVLVDKYFGL